MGITVITSCQESLGIYNLMFDDIIVPEKVIKSEHVVTLLNCIMEIEICNIFGTGLILRTHCQDLLTFGVSHNYECNTM